MRGDEDAQADVWSYIPLEATRAGGPPAAPDAHHG